MFRDREEPSQKNVPQASTRRQLLDLIKGKQPTKPELPEFVRLLQDIFPGQFFIGGSFAYKSLLGLPINSESDIDFFTNVQITRTGFIQILEALVFPFEEFTVDDITEDAPRYDMVDIRKVVKLRFKSSFKTSPAVEFIFLPENTHVPTYLEKQQATSISECYLSPDFSPVGYSSGGSVAFRMAQANKIVVVNEKNKATHQHLQKIANLCDEFGFTIK
jgi:hypothetical protein